MEFFIIIGITVVIIFIIRIGLKDNIQSPTSNQQIEIAVETVDEPEDFINGSFNTYIAGINHHCDQSDIGGFIGVVSPDPNNPYDKNAVAIYRNDANPKLLGYIGKSDLTEYRKWCNCKSFTCVGYIIPGDNSPVCGRIKIIKPYNENFVKNETDNYIKWMIEKYGKKFLPKGYTLEKAT